MKLHSYTCITAACLLLGQALPAWSAAPVPRISVVNEEALGPFPSWGNVKTTYGAVGDGRADDTVALQRALDAANQYVTNTYGWKQEKPNSPAVIYLPAGTYKISRTLMQKNGYGVSIIGEDPVNTRIVWAGATGGTMLIADGMYSGSYSRITWDGKSKAGIGIAQWWNSKTEQYGGSNEHTDEVFMDMGVGIVAGCCGKSSTPASHPGTDWKASEYGNLDSEGMVKRSKFIRMSVAGISTESPNALDWWVSDSQFIDCYRGVTNTLGDGGNILSYRNLFLRSKFADVHVGTPQWHSMHNNTSIGSRRFFEADNEGDNGGPMILKNNRIIDSTDPTPILLGALGPMFLIDNQIRTPQSTAAAVRQTNTANGRDVISIGNKFTAQNRVALPELKIDRLLTISDETVAAAAISSAAPVMPATPVRQNRRVFEVPLKINAGTIVNETTTAAIQAVINAAAASTDANPVVHFPRGTYTLTTTLAIPANRRIQLVGDSAATILKAGDGMGTKPLLRLAGPSLATVRDMRLFSNNYTTTAIAIDAADQSGGRIIISGSTNGIMNVSNLASTQIEGQSNSGFKGINAVAASSITTMGTGNIGAVTIRSNSNVMFNDTWYEGVKSDTLVNAESGNFSYLGGLIAPPDITESGAVAKYTMVANNFAGQFTVAGLGLEMKRLDQGIQIGKETAATNVMLLGMTSNVDGFYYTRTNSGGKVGFALMKKNRVTQVGNSGAFDNASVLKALTQARSLQWDSAPSQAPAGATDVLLYRLISVETAIAYKISGK